MPSHPVRNGHRNIVGMNWRERELVAELNPRRYHILADDKILGKQRLAAHGVPVPVTIAVIEGMRDVARVMKVLGRHEHFVIKPARGRAGSGIAVLGPRIEDGWYGASRTLWDEKDIRQRVGNILMGEYAMRTRDRALIEERVFTGPLLGDMPMFGLPDIRVITLQGSPVMSMVRLPTRRSGGKANLHLGALGIGVDLGTGVTTGATWCGRTVTRHPETGWRLPRMQVILWEEVLETARQAALAFPLGYLGIDIVITQRGRPLVLEVNARPGLEIQNANLRGLRTEIDRVLAEQGRTGETEELRSPQEGDPRV